MEVGLRMLISTLGCLCTTISKYIADGLRMKSYHSSDLT